ncbi:hypothetical protein KLP28_14880 [Nocardioidaceae bacterium]|nr:hypothetical protein KLP28_14880 [Nocardioidaceae bacterium]
MTATMDEPDELSTLARDLHRLMEPIHTVSYFSPESRDAIAACGFKGYWMGYFAARAAPLGAVGPAVVEATFYNFAPDRVRRALPDAWTFATPEEAMAARLTGATAALRRAITDRSPGADDAAVLEPVVTVLERCADAAPSEGRVLFAAQRSAPAPAEADLLGRLWQAVTSLREHRGDGHVAALLTLGVSGRESHVLAAARRGRTEPGMYAALRDFTDEEWALRQDSLRDQGVLDEAGKATQMGAVLIEELEAVTDRRASTAYESLTDDEAAMLRSVLAPLSAAAKPEAAG